MVFTLFFKPMSRRFLQSSLWWVGQTSWCTSTVSQRCYCNIHLQIFNDGYSTKTQHISLLFHVFITLHSRKIQTWDKCYQSQVVTVTTATRKQKSRIYTWTHAVTQTDREFRVKYLSWRRNDVGHFEEDNSRFFRQQQRRFCLHNSWILRPMDDQNSRSIVLQYVVFVNLTEIQTAFKAAVINMLMLTNTQPCSSPSQSSVFQHKSCCQWQTARTDIYTTGPASNSRQTK